VELQNDRIINGLLKAEIGFLTPEAVATRLAQDVAVVVEPSRSGVGDLWPCVWFLASVLERQFTGRVVIVAGLEAQLPAPLGLGQRCEFRSSPPLDAAISIFVGQTPVTARGISMAGDVRGNTLSYGRLLTTTAPAHPVSCCALAGYLGFAALAHAVGILPFREEFCRDILTLPFATGAVALPSFSVLGTGQVGQAFLALAHFLAGEDPVSIHILDKDYFEDYNQRTQILLPERREDWCEKPKVEYLSGLCRNWGWAVDPVQQEIKWGWKHKGQGQAFAFLGFDNMDARRMAVEGGFPWLFECGVGTDFCRPRVSWHSLPPDRELAKQLFKEPTGRENTRAAFAKSLSDSPGYCGRVIFENIDASAPSLGLVSVAATWAEVLNFLSDAHEPYSGKALIWSPLLPHLRDPLVARQGFSARAFPR
jgi:hypothetical protein